MDVDSRVVFVSWPNIKAQIKVQTQKLSSGNQEKFDLWCLFTVPYNKDEMVSVLNFLLIQLKYYRKVEILEIVMWGFYIVVNHNLFIFLIEQIFYSSILTLDHDVRMEKWFFDKKI